MVLIDDELLELISKYLFPRYDVSRSLQYEAALIEAGNNIVDWRRLLKWILK